MKTKASKEHWENIWKDRRPVFAPKNYLIRKWIEQYIPPVPNGEYKTCIEIGCYPGQFLSVFGDLGYTLYGVDYCKQLDILPEILLKTGYRIGNFWNEDFIKFDLKIKFDVVSSFGFIEHFINYIDILEKHIFLVKDNGYIVIEVPNFIGKFQNWFHKIFDNENYNRHFIPAMEIEKWEEILNKNHFKILYKGYFGNFEFWVEDEKRNLLTKLFLRIFSKISRVILSKVLPINKKYYSPFCGVIAVKSY